MKLLLEMVNVVARNKLPVGNVKLIDIGSTIPSLSGKVNSLQLVLLKWTGFIPLLWPLCACPFQQPSLPALIRQATSIMRSGTRYQQTSNTVALMSARSKHFNYERHYTIYASTKMFFTLFPTLSKYFENVGIGYRIYMIQACTAAPLGYKHCRPAAPLVFWCESSLWWRHSPDKKREKLPSQTLLIIN